MIIIVGYPKFVDFNIIIIAHKDKLGSRKIILFLLDIVAAILFFVALTDSAVMSAFGSMLFFIIGYLCIVTPLVFRKKITTTKPQTTKSKKEI